MNFFDILGLLALACAVVFVVGQIINRAARE
jgi:hypothetical protein